MPNKPDVPQRILFIGNSFTARNGLPDLIAQLAAAHGKKIEHYLISAGGASLRRHLNAGEALKEIENGHFDHVVLQEQSTLPVKNPKRPDLVPLERSEHDDPVDSVEELGPKDA